MTSLVTARTRIASLVTAKIRTVSLVTASLVTHRLSLKTAINSAMRVGLATTPQARIMLIGSISRILRVSKTIQLTIPTEAEGVTRPTLPSVVSQPRRLKIPETVIGRLRSTAIASPHWTRRRSGRATFSATHASMPSTPVI